MQGITLDDLPRTFRDATVCADRLSVRYLWIDSFCIIHDSEELFSVLFNLAATVSRTSNEGLFRHRTPSDINPCFFDLRYNEWRADVFHCVEAHYWENNVDCSILNTRAWTFQEM